MYRESGGEILYLLLKYKNGHWDFPKGHVELDETEEETLRRETEEETGITELEIIPGFVSENKYSYLARGKERKRRIESGNGVWVFKKVVFYIAKTNEEKVMLSDEHVDFMWLDYKEALRYVTYGNMRKKFKRAHKFLLNRQK